MRYQAGRGAVGEVGLGDGGFLVLYLGAAIGFVTKEFAYNEIYNTNS